MKIDLGRVYDMFPSVEILGVSQYYCFGTPQGWYRLDTKEGESVVDQIKRSMECGGTMVTLKISHFKNVEGEAFADFGLDELTNVPRDVLEARSTLRSTRLQLRMVEAEIRVDLVTSMSRIFKKNLTPVVAINPVPYYQDGYRNHKFTEVHNDGRVTVSILDHFGNVMGSAYTIELRTVNVDALVEITMSVISAFEEPVKECMADISVASPRAKVIL
jgi:hypothetical protein